MLLLLYHVLTLFLVVRLQISTRSRLIFHLPSPMKASTRTRPPFYARQASLSLSSILPTFRTALFAFHSGSTRLHASGEPGGMENELKMCPWTQVCELWFPMRDLPEVVVTRSNTNLPGELGLLTSYRGNLICQIGHGCCCHGCRTLDPLSGTTADMQRSGKYKLNSRTLTLFCSFSEVSVRFSFSSFCKILSGLFETNPGSASAGATAVCQCVACTRAASLGTPEPLGSNANTQVECALAMIYEHMKPVDSTTSRFRGEFITGAKDDRLRCKY